jgi:hypothetical protein
MYVRPRVVVRTYINYEQRFQIFKKLSLYEIRTSASNIEQK